MHIDSMGIIAHDLMARVGALIMGIVICMAVFAPQLSSFSPHDFTGKVFLPPGQDHPLGTDSMGQDIWARLLYGARTSLLVAGAVALFSTALSVLAGASAALAGGLYGRAVMRVVDAMICLPAIVVMILVAAYLRPTLPLLIILISAFSWPGGARIIRSQVLSLKEMMHINAARTFGAGKGHIIASHIIPELSPIISAQMLQDARRAVFMEAGLAFMGVCDPGVISWGKMMHQALAFTYLDVWQWWLVPTGLALSATLVGISLLSFSLEAAMDPRLRSITKHGRARLA